MGTLAFAVGGLLFDVACIVAFHRSNKKTGDVRQVNMFSALLHVGADSLRSGSTCVMSLLILLAGVNSTCLDANTSLFIGATIVLGAARPTRPRSKRALLRTSPPGKTTS